jgi:hypothetical protein
VKRIDAPNNRLIVELQDGKERTYDPCRQALAFGLAEL